MFNVIDFDTWDRKEIYERFYPCTYYITAEVDITRFLSVIKEKGLRFYPSICYCLTKVVNQHECYRYAKVDGKLGYFDILQPLYTVMRRNNLFTHKITNYCDDFTTFYYNFVVDAALAENGNTLYYDKSLPINHFCLSVMPNLRFSSINFSATEEEKTNFIPFATIGKYTKQGEKTTMPVAVEFHHEVNDGYHVAKFYEYLQDILDSFELA